MNIPGESAEYRAARDRLLAAEAKLRAEVEAVAALRRDLPEGPAPKDDYIFRDTDGGEVGFSDLFAPGRDALFLYSFMFAPAEGQGACPMCAAFLDSLNGAARHIETQASIVVAAKASPAELTTFAAGRGWDNLKLVSTAGTSFNRDYGAEAADGGQLPMAHVWKKTGETIRHFWSSELFHHASDWPHHPRHVDMMWPLWNVFDTLPGGRPDAWFPAHEYA